MKEKEIEKEKGEMMRGEKKGGRKGIKKNKKEGKNC